MKKIKEIKPIVESNFVSFVLAIEQAVKDGYEICTENKYSPTFMLTLFTCTAVIYEEAEPVVEIPTQQKRKPLGSAKADAKKAALLAKLPPEAVATPTATVDKEIK